MKRQMWKAGVAAMALGAFVAWEAVAWGPEAQRAMTNQAIQMIRRAHNDAFRADNTYYGRDVLLGAAAGTAALRDAGTFMTDAEAIRIVEEEIMLLRAAMEYGKGSYFAYRMGALSSLVSDLMLPFGVPSNQAEAELHEAIVTDLEDNLRRLVYRRAQGGPQVVHNAEEYFREQRAFRDNARQIIRAEYQRGDGFAGYVGNAANQYFSTGINAVVDVWHTVLRQQDPMTSAPPRRSDLAWYFVYEIEYHLLARSSQRHAERAYTNFEVVNPNLLAAHEAIGDAFYAFGAQERAVREWERALNATGGERRRVVEKLSRHYLDNGRDALAQAQTATEGRDAALSEAEQAFRRALEYDRLSDEAEELLTETNALIREREEQRRMVTSIMSGGESVFQQARQSAQQGDFGTAFAAYYRSRDLFESVDDAFPEQYQTAQNRLRTINTEVRRTVNQILDAAFDTLAEADRAVENNNFNQARQLYQQVNNIVDAIPEDVDDPEIEEVLSEAQSGYNQVDAAEQQWEQQQEQLQQAGGGAFQQ